MTVAVAAIGFSAGAHAASANGPLYASVPVSARVKLADLDLATPAGAAVGLQRIRRAAMEVCGLNEGVGPFEVERAYHACVRRTVDRTVDRMGNPVVADLNIGHRAAAILASNRH